MSEAIQPSPTPYTFQIAQVTDNNSGQQYTKLQILHLTGSSVFFLESGLAQLLGETLMKSATETASPGLIVPKTSPDIKGLDIK